MNGPRQRRRSRALALLFSGAIVGAIGFTGAGTASAKTTDTPATNQNTFSLSAEGDGMYYEIIDGSLPAVTDVAVSPYSSQATVDSDADSTALAGAPYLGPVLETIGGTVNGLSGGATPPIPPLPGYVTSSYPQQKTATEAQGPYLLLVNSGADESDASAGVGVSPNAGTTNQQVFSTAKVIANPDGSVQATASAGVDGLNIGPIDALNVSSNLSITETGNGGAPQIVQQENLGTFTILGFNIGITQNGFTVLGDNLPLPTSAILNEVNQALGKSGIQISVIPTTTGISNGTGATTITSGGLQITEVYNVPSQGVTTVQYTYGRATVGAADVANALGDDSSDDTDTTAPLSTPTTASSDAPDTTVPTSAPSTQAAVTPITSSAPVVPAPAPAADAAIPAAASASTPLDDSASLPLVAAPATSGSLNTTVPVRTLGFIRASAPLTGTNSRLLYLVLVFGGLLAFIGQSIFRNLGIRLHLHA